MIHEVLMYGEENAIPARDLVAVLGLKDVRELTTLVTKERREGFPICAVTSGKKRGYFLAENAEEMQRYIESLRRRVGNICRTLEACQNIHAQMSEQTAIGV